MQESMCVQLLVFLATIGHQRDYLLILGVSAVSSCNLVLTFKLSNFVSN